MYTITHNGKTLYDPRLPGFPVERPKLAREANVFDTLTFTLYPPHPEYGELDRSSSILGLYQDSSLVAQFIPVYQRTVFNGGIEYKCKNILCRMEDFYYRPLEFSGTASEFIDSVLSSYNARVDNAYKVTKGNVHSASVDYKTSDPKTCFSALKTITDANGGYLAPRFENGIIYLDYLQDADLPVCEQKIVFGDNMTDLFIEKDTDNCYSVLYPFGTNSDNEVVSIADENSGVDYLENASAVATYGKREKKLSWANVETPAELLSYAQAKLSEIAAQYYEAVSLSAVDLHHLDVSIPALSFLSMIDCVSAPHGYSHRYPDTKMEIPLDEPKSESINLGTAPLSMTDRITLERQKNEETRSSYGRAISKAESDIEKHWTHVTTVTDQGMEDCFGVIGVKLDPNTHQPMKDDQGNYIWAGANDASAEIWNHFHRTAWQTLIANVVKDGQGNVLSIGQVSTSADGQVFINAINDQRTGTAKISANRILIGTTSGSYLSIDEYGQLNLTADNAVAAINAAETLINAGKIQLTAGDQTQVTLDSIFSVDTDGYIELGATTMINGNLLLTGGSRRISGVETLSIGYSDPTSQTSVGTFNFRGESYNKQAIRLGLTSPFIASAAVLTVSNKDIDLNHAHSVTMTEETSGTNAGKVHAIIGEPVTYNSSSTTNRESFFDIAASQTYLNGVAAAEKRGWNSAAAAIIFPGAASGEHLTDTLVIPDTWTATDDQGPTKNIGLRLEKSATASAQSAVTAQYSEDGTNWTKFLRINVGNFYVDGWGAAYRKVSYPSVRSEQETGDTLSMTFGSPSSTVGTADSITYTLSATQWNGNTAFAKVKTGNDDVLRLTLDATPSYRAGSASVGLASPDWGTAPSPLTDSRTVSVSTSGRVDSNGTAANLTKAIALYLTQGSFDSAHKMTVSLRDTSSSGTIRAETEVDASEIHYAGWNSAASAVSYPGTASGQVLNATLTLPNTGASSSMPAPTKDVLFRVEKSATPSANAAVTAQYSTNNGSTYTKFLRINVGNMYTAGWDAASALTDPPSAGTGIGTSFVFKAPTTTTDQQGNVTRAQTTFNFTLTKGATPGNDGYAAVEFGGRAVGQIPIGDWYTAGQNSVNVTMGSWNNGQVTFSPSAGSGDSKTLALSNISGLSTITSNGRYTYETMYEDDNQEEQGTGLTKTVAVNVSTTPDGSDIWLGVIGNPGYSYGSRPADTSGNASKQVGIYYQQQDGTWLCLRNGTVSYDQGGSGGSSADQIDLYNFQWQGDTWNTGGSTRLGTMGQLFSLHKNDRGYIVFDAQVLDGSGSKRYFIPVG